LFHRGALLDIELVKQIRHAGLCRAERRSA
jgi:hypothetical protein